jgi:NDP-sugar pyrophosphorylase family protein
MANSVINAGAEVRYSIIDEDVIVGWGAKIGEERETASGITVLAKDITIGGGVTVSAGNMIDADILQ